MRVLKPEVRGFTLVEALVALAILAVMLGAVMAGVSGAAQNDSRAEFLVVASRFAQSRLVLAGVSGPLVAGRKAGVSADGMAWEESIEPRVSVDQNNPLFWVRVEVWPGRSAGAGSPFVLETAKIFRPAVPQ